MLQWKIQWNFFELENSRETKKINKQTCKPIEPFFVFFDEPTSAKTVPKYLENYKKNEVGKIW